MRDFYVTQPCFVASCVLCYVFMQFSYVIMCVTYVTMFIDHVTISSMLCNHVC